MPPMQKQNIIFSVITICECSSLHERVVWLHILMHFNTKQKETIDVKLTEHCYLYLHLFSNSAAHARNVTTFGRQLDSSFIR